MQKVYKSGEFFLHNLFLKNWIGQAVLALDMHIVYLQ